MGRSERRDFFERLCSLRDSYGAGPDDRRGTLSIEDAVIYAEAVILALDEPARVDAETAADSVTDLAADAGIAVAPDADPVAAPAAATDTSGPTDASQATHVTDTTDASEANGRGAGRWTTDTDGWHHLDRFFDRHGPAGDRP
jgi:hypothetical protein